MQTQAQVKGLELGLYKLSIPGDAMGCFEK